MKKFVLMSVAAVTAFVVAGCVSYNTSDGATLSPIVSADHPGYEANLDVQNTRVQGEATVNVLFGIFAWGTDGYADRTNFASAALVLPTMPFAAAASAAAPSLPNLPLPELPNASKFVKEAAVYNTCKAQKIDQLIASRYDIKTVDYFVFKIMTCKVDGFPAKTVGITQKKPFITQNGKLVWLAEPPTVLK